MRTRIIISFFILSGLLLLSPVMRAGDHDSAISVALNNMVRHEKRFLSTSDIFDIGIYPDQNMLIVSARVDDDYHNHYYAIISPIDTTVKSGYIPEEEKLVWVSPSSKDTVMTCSNCFSENYSISFGYPQYEVGFCGFTC